MMTRYRVTLETIYDNGEVDTTARCGEDLGEAIASTMERHGDGLQIGPFKVLAKAACVLVDLTNPILDRPITDFVHAAKSAISQD